MVWLGLVTRTGPRAQPVPYLPQTSALRPPAHGCTSIHFGENQLSPGSIGISPLPTGHPPVLQHRWVRASTWSYPRFTLPMGSSPGLGSHLSNPAPCSDAPHAAPPQRRGHVAPRFRSGPTPSWPGLNHLAAAMNSPDHSTKGTPSPAWPLPPKDGRPASFDCLWVAGFRRSFTPLAGCFSPFPHGTRALSVAGCIHALEGVPPCFPQDGSCPAVPGA